MGTRWSTQRKRPQCERPRCAKHSNAEARQAAPVRRVRLNFEVDAGKQETYARSTRSRNFLRAPPILSRPDMAGVMHVMSDFEL